IAGDIDLLGNVLSSRLRDRGSGSGRHGRVVRATGGRSRAGGPSERGQGSCGTNGGGAGKGTIRADDAGEQSRASGRKFVHWVGGRGGRPCEGDGQRSRTRNSVSDQLLGPPFAITGTTD